METTTSKSDTLKNKINELVSKNYNDIKTKISKLKEKYYKLLEFNGVDIKDNNSIKKLCYKDAEFCHINREIEKSEILNDAMKEITEKFADREIPKVKIEQIHEYALNYKTLPIILSNVENLIDKKLNITKDNQNSEEDSKDSKNNKDNDILKEILDTIDKNGFISLQKLEEILGAEIYGDIVNIDEKINLKRKFLTNEYYLIK